MTRFPEPTSRRGPSRFVRDGDLDRLHRLAAEQGGAFSRVQALALGFTGSAIDANVVARRWQRIHPGVLAEHAGPVPYRTRVWAALLWAGEGAALAGPAALRAYGFATFSHVEHIDVVVNHDRKVTPQPGLTIRRRRGLAQFVHPTRRPTVLRLEDAVLHHAASQDDIAAGIGVLADACQQRKTTPDRLRTALKQLPRLRARCVWQGVLDDITAGATSFLEISYLRDVERAHGLPTPRRQMPEQALGRRVWRDGVYDEYGVVLELDGRLGHEWSTGQQSDRRRDLVVAGQGKVTLRAGYGDVLGRSCQTAALVAKALQARGWQDQPKPCRPGCLVPQLMHQLQTG